MLQVALLLPQKCFNNNLSSHVEVYIGYRSTTFMVVTHHLTLYGFGARPKNNRQVLYEVDWKHTRQ